MVKMIEGGVTAATGFKAGGIYSGIKANSEKPDLALIVSEVPGNAAAVYTKNKVKAAHIAVTKKHLANGVAQAVLCNSGNANTCTPDGEEVAEKATQIAAECLGIKADDVLPAATGVIGVPLPIEPFMESMPELAGSLSRTGSADAALAILTTDTYIKECAVQFDVGDTVCTLGGIAKGSGMIHINMGTMLSFISTDCAISQELVSKALHEEIADSYNQVSVDGDTSTNDTVMLLANGLAGNEMITSEGEDLKEFKDALFTVAEFLAKNIAKDGEGATRLFTCHVTGAKDNETARILAKSVITSNLTKAAVFGMDANCGRLFCAMGYSGAEFDPDHTDIILSSKNGSIKLIADGMLPEFSEEEALSVLQPDEIVAECILHEGDGEATAWGCDLTYDYVKINADYRS